MAGARRGSFLQAWSIASSGRVSLGAAVRALWDLVRPILKALSANQAVGILIDQNASLENGAFVPFFGVPACAGTGFARLAERSGAAVIPGFASMSRYE